MEVSEVVLERLKACKEAEVVLSAAIHVEPYNMEDADAAQAEYDKAKLALYVRVDIELGHLKGAQS